LKNKKKCTTQKCLAKDDVLYLCKEVSKIFSKQPIFLELIPPLTVCGDIHGQFFDLIRTFEAAGDPQITNYLFLGDYVDRGPNSVNVICLLFAYKIKYPNNFFLLRGNQEYGFYEECKKMYDVHTWKAINDVFLWMPVAALIENRIFCVHAGISPSFHSFSDIKALKRPLDIPDTGLLCDLTWSDPDSNVVEWGPNDRGTSYTFGLTPLKKLMSDLQIELVVRAHQLADNGYLLPFNPDKSMLTIFGAPNYTGTMGNKAAILHISSKMICTFSILEPISNTPKPKTATTRSAGASTKRKISK
jgi:serine/threonine-protein phosphatase PP1 catalytic subunit